MAVETTNASVELVRRDYHLTPDEVRTERARYRELCESVLEADDWQQVRDKKFVKRSGFQVLGAANNVTTSRLSMEIDRDPESGDILRARCLYRASDPKTGRSAEASGACSIKEKRFRMESARERDEHDIITTAETRATSRAISNLVAFGAVSAEEVTEEATAPPAWAQPAADPASGFDALRDALEAAGVQNANVVKNKIGNAILDRCDETIPQIAADVVALVATAMNPPRAAE